MGSADRKYDSGRKRVASISENIDAMFYIKVMHPKLMEPWVTMNTKIALIVNLTYP